MVSKCSPWLIRMAISCAVSRIPVANKAAWSAASCLHPHQLGVPARQSEPGLDLGDLGTADGNAMRRRAVEFDDRAVALLADEGHVRDRHDVAAVHPDEQAGIELGFGLRNRPRAHPLAGAVMHPGIMCIRADAAHLGGVDEV